MAREPFLLQFAEPVVELEPAILEYDPATLRNRVQGSSRPLAASDIAANGTVLTETREQRDHAEHSSVGWEGTVVTMTSETKDHVEDDRVLNESVEPSSMRPFASMLGTKKTGNGEQSDPTDGDHSHDVTARNDQSDRLLGLIGTKKTDSREQSDPADGEQTMHVTGPISGTAPDRLVFPVGMSGSAGVVGGSTPPAKPT